MPTVSDRTPLLENGNGAQRPKPFYKRVIDSLSAEGEPSWLHSYKFFLFGSYLNILLVFVPLSFVSHFLDWDAALRFSFSFIAIMPLAALLGTATDQLSLKLGQTLSGLLNASFGNAVEIIVGIAALLQGELRIVQTSLLGSILSNLLLVLGCSFLAGGTKYSESNFQVTAAQASSSLMTLTCITLVIPAAYHSAKSHSGGLEGGANGTSIAPLINALDPRGELGLDNLDAGSLHGLKIISRGTAILLLIVYIAYLFFQLKTHSYLYTPTVQADDDEEPEMNIWAAGSALLIVTVVTSFCADYLVASIEETANRYSIPKPFIGLILLPIVANAAEHVTSVWMALKNKMELTIGICVGSSIQIAAFVVPLLVIVGWITHHDLTLFFADFETIVLFVSVLLVNFLIQDGKSNYMEGLMLLTLYLVIALACKLLSLSVPYSFCPLLTTPLR
ncbi:Sodium/calcium exchanger protein-domain-containing protein [Cubamyces menziesii]|nr:Sodium/calcium exchanger protein-domain-containing protein [Cubamyces menziesii]